MVQGASTGETRSRDIELGSGARDRYVGVTVQPYEGGAIAIATGVGAGAGVALPFGEGATVGSGAFGNAIEPP